MFRVKICGIRTTDAAQASVAAGADAIGLNFYARSRRYVTPEQALNIAQAVPAEVQRVGVFVNSPAEEIRHIVDHVGLSAVQLHGDEPPDFLAELARLSIVRARRIDAGGLATVAADLVACRVAGRAPDALLVDAAAPSGQYGGTGETLAWDKLSSHRTAIAGVPLILAGGLDPANVGQAIDAARPDGVDVASGVELAPGEKDAALTMQFVQNALAAFDALA